MKKIISLFQRNHDGNHQVRNELMTGAEWVVNNEGVATRKWDGTCCLITAEGKFYKRYDVKKGKQIPTGFIPAQDPDPVTGHHPGWLLIGDGPEDRWFREAYQRQSEWAAGSYELCGPKIGGKGGVNPENLSQHILIPHGKEILPDVPRSFELLRQYFIDHALEGIVWWRDINDPDCDKVKIKTHDFGLPWPIKK